MDGATASLRCAGAGPAFLGAAAAPRFAIPDSCVVYGSDSRDCCQPGEGCQLFPPCDHSHTGHTVLVRTWLELRSPGWWVPGDHQSPGSSQSGGGLSQAQEWSCRPQGAPCLLPPRTQHRWPRSDRV